MLSPDFIKHCPWLLRSYLYLPYMVDLSQYKKLTNSDLIEHIEHIDRIGVNIYTRETSNCSHQN